MTDLLAATDLGVFEAVALAVMVGAIEKGTPFLFVSLGECLTEKAGRVNLGQEGTLVLGAMTGFAVSYAVANNPFWGESLAAIAPWMGVLAAAAVGLLMGALHAIICNLPRVNHVAVGIAMMMFGTGLAFFLGKAYINPHAPPLPSIDLGFWSSSERVQTVLRVNALFLVGIALAPLMAWVLKNTRPGLIVRLAGENEDAATAMGFSVKRIRIYATALGGALAGVAGSYLSLYLLRNWNERVSTGQGLMAVALVIFARWKPVNCLWTALVFGGAASLGSVLRGQELSSPAMGYIWDAAPYILTLGIMILTSSRSKAMAGAPGELTRVR